MIVAVTVAVTLALSVLDLLSVSLVVRAVADNEPRPQPLGFPTHAVKGAAFALSAELLIAAAVGGRFHVMGPLFGAVSVGWAAAELRDIFPYWQILMAMAFILVVLRVPGGIAELY